MKQTNINHMLWLLHLFQFPLRNKGYYFFAETAKIISAEGKTLSAYPHRQRMGSILLIKHIRIMTKYFLILSTLFLCLGMAGCQAAEEKTEEEATDISAKLNSAPFSQTVFPEWLTIKINDIESTYSDTKYRSLAKIKIFKGEWNKETVYLIYNYLSSCLLCELHNESGEKITFAEKNVEDDLSIPYFSSTSSNWVLIYEYSNNVDY